MRPELSVIIVNWNGGELLRRTVESLVGAPPSLDFEVVVIDNASGDESLRLVRESESLRTLAAAGRLRVIENSDNLGFGRANNQAFALTETPLLLLLNPDTEVTPGSLDRLIAAVRSDARTGAAGPRLLNLDGSLQVSVWRNPPTAWATLLSGLRLHRLLPGRVGGELLLAEHWSHDRRRPVNMLSGAAVLVRREVLDEVGGFDERFSLYGEDNEWCLRVARAGWRLIFEPEAVVRHHGGSSSLKRWTPPEKLRVQTLAFLDFQNYCLPRRRVVGNLAASCFMLSLQRLARRLKRRDAAEVELVLGLHSAELRRLLRAGRGERGGTA